MELFHGLDDLGSSITFVWCPSHVGIEGNEECDAEARHSAVRPQVDAAAIRPDYGK